MDTILNNSAININSQNKRFAFGKNWANFLNNLTEDRIIEAKTSLKNKLQLDNLTNLSFLDIGSGSGLFSLAAYRLGANVYSFDYDLDSVACTKFLQQKYASSTNNNQWTVTQGSVLDVPFLQQLGTFDIVYSWGVLHHTGSMYQAFTNIINLIKPHGKLFISIYNNQGGPSRRWTWIKKTYNSSNHGIKLLLCCYTLFRQWTITFVKDFIKTGNPFKHWLNYGKNNRGMSAWHDVVDWTGGYPFEVATPEQVFDFFKSHNFQLDQLKTCAGGVGCNEFVFINQS
jgi:2-polyprenyl-6-hydroxyphenyl methylase/3-demethylubiquinone-9 3-methyltransferase